MYIYISWHIQLYFIQIEYQRKHKQKKRSDHVCLPCKKNMLIPNFFLIPDMVFGQVEAKLLH